MDDKQERKYLRAKNRFWSMYRSFFIKTAVIFCIALLLHSAVILCFQHRFPSYDENNTIEVTTRVLDFRFERINNARSGSSTILFVDGEEYEFYTNIIAFGKDTDEISDIMNKFKSSGSVLTIRCVPPREFIPNYLEDGRYRILHLSENDTVYVDHIDEANKNQKAIRMIIIIAPAVIELIFVGVFIICIICDYRNIVMKYRMKTKK